MSRILRIISTAVVGAGLILLFLYLCLFENTGKELALSQPSYYTIQNYLYIFLSGVGCIAFSIISSFFSWNKALDKKEEILPNAISAEKGTVESWLTGSSLDTKRGTVSMKTTPTHEQLNNEVSTVSDTVKEKTVGVLDADQIIVQVGGTQTQLDQEETILDNSEATILEENADQTILEDDTSKDTKVDRR